MKTDVAQGAGQARRSEQDPERNESVTVERDDRGGYVLRIAAPSVQTALPDLVTHKQLLAEGWEDAALRALEAAGEISAPKIGRQRMYRRSELLAAWERKAATAPRRAKPAKVRAESPADALAQLAQAERRRGAR